MIWNVSYEKELYYQIKGIYENVTSNIYHIEGNKPRNARLQEEILCHENSITTKKKNGQHFFYFDF